MRSLVRGRRGAKPAGVRPLFLALTLALGVALLTGRAAVARALPTPAMSDGRVAGVLLQVDDGELPVPTHDPIEANQHADDILERPEFRPPQQSLVERAVGWISEQLGRLLSAGGGSGGSVVGWLLLVALVAGVVKLLSRIQSVPIGTTTRTEAEVVVEEKRSAREWEALVAAHEAAGDWLEALRCRYRALVARLVERRILADVPGRTVGEYRDELHQASPAATSAFDEATSVYEDAWFGSGAAGPDEARRFAEGAARVVEEVTP